MKTLPKFTFGVGDRFGLEGEAQLKAIMEARRLGFDVSPVWNKSNREHSLVGTRPEDVRTEADEAVKALEYDGPYFVDADHIRLDNVDAFTSSSDFFTIDVADSIGTESSEEDIDNFVIRHSDLIGQIKLDGKCLPIEVSSDSLSESAARYLAAVHEAAKVYRRIVERRGQDDFATEISMDETFAAQSPAELLAILAMISDEHIPVQTIAPKFTGEFHKGVDYIGDVNIFASEFDADVAVTKFAAKRFALPENLKLSVHSGSDKFALYDFISKSAARHNAGFHLKTAGTTWLEEVAGLSASGPEGLAIAKKICLAALPELDTLCAPYSAVLTIDKTKLPSAEEIASWDSETFAGKLVHDCNSPLYSPDFRQFVHVSYSIAASLGSEYTDAIKTARSKISEFVSFNILERHLKPLAGLASDAKAPSARW